MGPQDRKHLLLGSVVLGIVGALVLAFLQGPGAVSPTHYHGDLTQSPHWVAYHGDSFARDDLLVEYATYNETPLQNAIYWVGTLFLDVVPLNKLVGIAIYGLTAALFFLLVSLMSNMRVGVLAALMFTIFPRSSYEIAGGFSKAWAIGLVLAAVYVVETRHWRVLPWLMPFAALAYPVAPVLIGAIALVGLALELPRSVPDAWRGVKQLALGSAIALVPLLYKYFTPPPRIGEMISTAGLKAMWENGLNSDFTLPLWQEALSYVQHPFFVYSTVLLLMLLWRRGLVWERSWTALVIASSIGFLVADLVVPRLYLPDRYTRYSIAVLLVLWHAANWSRVLETFRRPWVQRAAAAGLIVCTALGFPDAFRPSDGDKSLGRWEDRREVAALSRVIAALPEPVLVAGNPYDLGDIMVQARRPVLVIHRMFHAWFIDYRAAIDQRIRDTLAALYARDARDVNLLAERYGVTHLVVPRSVYRPESLRTGKIYRSEYAPFVTRLTRGPRDFVLDPPPPEAVVADEDGMWLVRLPLAVTPTSGKASRNVPADPRPDAPRQRKR